MTDPWQLFSFNHLTYRQFTEKSFINSSYLLFYEVHATFLKLWLERAFCSFDSCRSFLRPVQSCCTINMTLSVNPVKLTIAYDGFTLLVGITKQPQ